MPIATVSTDYGPPIPLKSLEGATVRLRPLSYGKRLERLDKATKMYMEMSDDEVRGRRSKKAEPEAVKAFIESMNSWARGFDFSYCVGEHNLEDAKGQLLDFSNPMTLEVLNPRVGGEIARMLDEINGEDDEDELSDFIKQHTRSLQEEPAPEASSQSETGNLN